MVGSVIPANAGIQPVFAGQQSVAAKAIWIPARAALGRDDGHETSASASEGNSPSGFLQPLCDSSAGGWQHLNRLLDTLIQHMHGFNGCFFVDAERRANLDGGATKPDRREHE